MKILILAALSLLTLACSKNSVPDSSRVAPVSSEIDVIGGTPVDPTAWKSVVKISTNSSACTATIIGPRVFVTAAHCGKTDQVSAFSIDGEAYSAKLERSPLYPGQDHDISLGLIDKEVKVQPVTVGGQVEVGTEIMLMGYGCTKPGGGGGNDGILREGKAKVTSFSAYDAVTKGDAALCFGDSGGPGMVQEQVGKVGYLQAVWKIALVNSKGNIKDTSYGSQLAHSESKKFLQAFVEKHKVEICGVNKDCNSAPLPEFHIENKFAKVVVTVKDDESMSAEYMKTNFENLMRFLESGGATGFEFYKPSLNY